MRLLLAIAAGVATGLLISPKSGRENREDLQRESDRLRRDMEDKLNTLLAQGRDSYNKILSDMMIEETAANSKTSKGKLVATSNKPVKTTPAVNNK